MIVYKAINTLSGKSYVGMTVCTLNVRKSGHKYLSRKDNPKLHFHRALKVYGWDNFIWEILWEGNNIDEMGQMEIQCIKEHKTLTPDGYNLTEGNDNTTLGYTYTPEQKKRYRQIRRNMENPPNKGNKWNDEQKRHMSEIMSNPLINKNRGDNNSAKRPEVRKKISEANMGDKNGMAKTFRLTCPEGNVIIIHGGIKRKLKELGLSYPSFQKTGTAKGWILERIEEDV